MKKILMLILLIILNTKISQSMDMETSDSNVLDPIMYAKIPNIRVLESRFNEILLGDFFEHTTSIAQLADRQVNVLIVLGAVNYALCEYDKFVNEPETASFMRGLKPEILEIILGDLPEALAQLKEIMVKIKKSKKVRQEIKKKQNLVVFRDEDLVDYTKIQISIMKNDLPIKNSIVIPEHELEITTSRGGGPGGQHVNKTDTRITVRWNVLNTTALNEEQRNRVFLNLQSRLTAEGDIIVHNNETRSQQQNKKLALANLAKEVRKALHVPKKRKPTTISNLAKETRLQSKMQRGTIKKERSKKYYDE